MKKLNNKGFTLVELLAVIIILAIVVGITIPAVMTTVNNAKKSAGQSAARSAADWVDRQYQAAQTGFDVNGAVAVDTAFTAVCGNQGATCKTKQTLDIADATNGTKAKNFIQSAGLLTTNVNKIEVQVNTNGRSCVKIYAIPNTDYYDTSNSSTTQTYTGGVC